MTSARDLEVTLPGTYPKPNTSADYRADARECIDRAQRALEVAEINIDTVGNLFNQQSNGGGRVAFADLIAAVEARRRLALAWIALGQAKSSGAIV